MRRGYNELVGLQATFSRVIPRYSLTHHYRWRTKGKLGKTGTLRGYDMHQYTSSLIILRGLRDAYAPAILTIWRCVTDAVVTEYYQFEVNATPAEMSIEGEWHVWAEL